MIAFIMQRDGLSFYDACKALGIGCARKPRPTMTTSRRTAAKLAADWCSLQSARLNAMIADAMAQRDDADETGAFELAASLDRELTMLRGFYASLNHPGSAAEMLASRGAIEKLTNGSRATL